LVEGTQDLVEFSVHTPLTLQLMKTKHIFSYILCSIVVVITLFSVLAIWEIVPWDFMMQYFGKTIKSLIVIGISAVIIYVIQALLQSNEQKS
jgi:hypothetical protein